MVFFAVAIKVLIFSFCFAAILAILFYVPLTIYVIPYSLWVGHQNTKGKHKDKLQKGEKLSRTAKCATKLYLSWITKKTPTFD